MFQRRIAIRRVTPPYHLRVLLHVLVVDSQVSDAQAGNHLYTYIYTHAHAHMYNIHIHIDTNRYKQMYINHIFAWDITKVSWSEVRKWSEVRSMAVPTCSIASVFRFTSSRFSFSVSIRRGCLFSASSEEPHKSFQPLWFTLDHPWWLHFESLANCTARIMDTAWYTKFLRSNKTILKWIVRFHII